MQNMLRVHVGDPSRSHVNRVLDEVLIVRHMILLNDVRQLSAVHVVQEDDQLVIIKINLSSIPIRRVGYIDDELAVEGLK